VGGGFGIAAFARIIHIAVTGIKWRHSNRQDWLCLDKAHGQQFLHKRPLV
jgi:hypothetical protein